MKNIKLFIYGFIYRIMNYINYYNSFYENIEKTEVNTSIYENNFYYDPTDIFYTFCSLVQKTYPHGTEADVLKWIKKPLQEDEYGNFFIKIGESSTMFTSHFDSATSRETPVKLITFEKNGNKFVTSDGKTILGADDKAGVTVMLYMIENNIPGLYYFFAGEEVGGVGSSRLARDRRHSNLKGIKRCISFDRRGYNSVITEQMMQTCCSNKFAKSLCKQFNKYGIELSPDDTGLFTDSANFIGVIEECTNISVGYYNEHTSSEIQNMTYLESLCKVCLNIDWENI
jgi:putative aminopeptidase FrvX